MIILLIIGLAICLGMFLVGWWLTEAGDAAVFSIFCAIIGTIFWAALCIYGAGTEPITCPEPEKKVVAVQPVGHRSSTTYVITAADGTPKEIDNPPVLGQMYCFNPHQGWHWPSWKELVKAAWPDGGSK